MAEGFESYHVPQQSRRDKLRVVNISQQNHHQSVDNLQGCAALLPFYDPSSLIPADLMTCSSHHAFHLQNLQLLASADAIKRNPTCIAKEDGFNLMGYPGGTTATSTLTAAASHCSNNVDEQAFLAMNHVPIPITTSTSVHDINNHPLFYPEKNTRDFDYNDSLVLLHNNTPQPHHPGAATGAGQGLSLSLSSQQSHHRRGNNLPLELNLQRCKGDVARYAVSLGPFPGYASILKGSRYLTPAQQLLEEICDVGRENAAEKMVPDSILLEPPPESFTGPAAVEDSLSCSDGGEHKRTKSRLIFMLEEVCRRYRQYYQQVQTVIASFESVAGLSNAALFTNLAFKTMSKHFRCLRTAITEQLHSTSKSPGNVSIRREGILRSDSYNKDCLYSHRPLQNTEVLNHQPAWRPQRGLPERAVSVLRAWLFEHFLHPYPNDSDKVMLAKQTGLSRSQVSNWFINARVRLWKPMVEEIHALQTRQAQKGSQNEEFNATRPNNRMVSSNSLMSDNTPPSAAKNQDPPFKRLRNGLPELQGVSDHPTVSHHNHFPIAVGGSASVSLTLGLHQHNGIGLTESFPTNITQRYRLSGDQGCVMDGLEDQNGHFSRDVIGAQFLHDFVG
ncbi:hypothetical protein Nepgr_012021 [Nepenthes gracilis]|uniref:Homeobox domain-containing protein n=1 Tax=Nepenthes gracilis TaxID=150966 RepID=A0AAD3SG61_NEPGR|nr:hypothetical protein Nepgr_012021 [Nepenthes gracilis]